MNKQISLEQQVTEFRRLQRIMHEKRNFLYTAATEEFSALLKAKRISQSKFGKYIKKSSGTIAAACNPKAVYPLKLETVLGYTKILKGVYASDMPKSKKRGRKPKDKIN